LLCASDDVLGVAGSEVVVEASGALDSVVGAADAEVAVGCEPVGVFTLAASSLQAARPRTPTMARAPTVVRRNMLLDMTFPS
jgi:hypothetical protein